MRVALITESAWPDARGENGAWCDRLVRGLTGHEFQVYALGGGPGAGRPPVNATTVRILAPAPAARLRRPLGRRRAMAAYRELAGALAAGGEPASVADRFADALYGLAEVARAQGCLSTVLRSEAALRALESACRAPGVRPLLGTIGVPDLITAAALLERAMRPLSAPWYEPDGDALATADLCHATSGGTTVLPGLLAKRFFGTPFLVTEYGVRFRETLLAYRAAGHSGQVRSLLGAFHRLLAGEAYREAALLTPGNTHARRWQELCGADRARIRTVHPGYPGFDALPEADGPEAEPARTGRPGMNVRGADGRGTGGTRSDGPGTDAPTSPTPGALATRPAGPAPTLLWAGGRAGPAKDLVGLLHAFAEVRKAEPAARLRIVHDGGDDAYLAQCAALAAQLFPDEAASAVTVGENPVSFEPSGPRSRDPYDPAGDVVVLSSAAEGFPHTLVEAMFRGRATVSTDVGAVCEVIGGTGLVVPPRNPKALADACVVLLRDPQRRRRLGAAARERALELFTVEQNMSAFQGIYLQAVAHSPARAASLGAAPFARPAESRVPGRWATTRPAPRWARDRAVCLQEDPV